MTRVPGIGDYIREQRKLAELSLRQLAATAGVSNPYLSQIERGSRKPSAEILRQLATALQISAESLYIRAGILEDKQGDVEVRSAILADESITDRQRQVLLDIYEAFQKENEVLASVTATRDAGKGHKRSHTSVTALPTSRVTTADPLSDNQAK